MKKYILTFLFIFITFTSLANTVSADKSFGYHYDYNRVLEQGSGGNDVVLAKFCLAVLGNNFSGDFHGYFNSQTKSRVKNSNKKTI